MSSFAPGALVKFRGREWVILPSEEKEVLSLKPLTGSELDRCGVYLPLEKKNIEPTTFPHPTIADIGDFESARLLRNAARLLLRYGAGPFRSFGFLSFYPRPYQLVPLLMALRMDTVRMLIADDVGIGKTVEAGLIAREFLDRGEIKRIAVVCPPYLCDQWKKELAEKFNINATVITTKTLASLERGVPRQDVSVFEYYPHIIVSVDFVKGQKRREAFLLNCPELVIVDEAHGCARPAGQSASQQQRHQLILDLVKKENRHTIFLTATPHSGFEESFLSLLGFIKPSFESLNLEDLSETQRAELAHHFVQRRRADVKQWMGTDTYFPERESEEIPYSLSPEYKKLFREIYQFARELVRSGETQSGFKRRVRYWTALALLRCVMSSPASAKASLMARFNRLSEEPSEESDYSKFIFDPSDIDSVEDIVPTHIVEEGDLAFTEGERKKIQGFVKAADSVGGKADTKIQKAIELVRGLLHKGFSPIVYCRFIQTANYVADVLKSALSSDLKDVRVIAVTGESSDDEREQMIQDLAVYTKRVLIATDCLSEGINLQDKFNAVIHYDLPWNPNRLEQREGRVDRFGQTAPVVKAILLYGVDNPIDGAVLEVLLRKAKKIHRSLGISVPLPVDSESLMDTVLKALLLREEESPQLALFEKELPIAEIHDKWDRSAEREKKSRTRFAQHAIKPDEVSKELSVTDKVLGDPQTVKEFLLSVSQRLGNPLLKTGDYFKVNPENYPEAVRTKLKDSELKKIKFDYPVESGATYISRNHPLPMTLSEFLVNSALQPEGDRNIASRCGIIRSNDVDEITVLLLLRLRFLISDTRSETPSFAEECIVTGYKGGEVERWLTKEEAEFLLEQAQPSGNLTSHDRNHWVNLVLEQLPKIEKKIDEIATERAGGVLESYERVRKTIKISQISIEALSPIDILSLSLIIPQPR